MPGSCYKVVVIDMKHFWKLTGSLFGKILISRVFGFVLTATIFLAVEGKFGSIITQVISVLIMVIMMFSTAQEHGARDANMINTGNLKGNRWLGFTTGLVASSLDIIAAICLLLTKAGVVGYGFSVLFGLYNCNYLPFHQALVSPTLTVGEISWGAYIVTALTVLIAPLCAGLGYRLGLTQLTLSDTLLYTTPESRKKHALRQQNRKKKWLKR